jgi:lysylphosphatidylglycerol synthetase-like protein (DUF2156 family)
MVDLFDLVSFFGLAAFFAWLGYAPLRTQLLKEVEPEKREKAKENLDTITDYFLIAFLSFSVAAVSDYVYHHRFFNVATHEQWFLTICVIGASFVLGLFNLFVPITYIRARNLGNISLPPFMVTFQTALLTAIATVLWIIDFSVALTFLGRSLSVLSGLVLYVAAIRNLSQSGGRGWRPLLNSLLILSPLYVMFLLIIFRTLPL